MKIYKIEKIKNHIKNNALSKSKFCKLSHISISTLNKILVDDDNVNIIALFKIARLMNIPIRDLFY